MAVSSAIVQSVRRQATCGLAISTPRRLNLRSLRRGLTQWLGWGQRRASAPASVPLLLRLLGLNWAVALVVALVLLIVSALLLGRQGLTRLRRAWSREEQTLERSRALEQTLGRLHQQRDELELALSSSARQIDEFKALLRPRCGLLASVLVPAEQREEFVCSERCASLRSRKLAEFLSLLLDVLNWKLGQGSPLSRSQFWEAFELCEAMAQHLAPAEAEAATCLAQLHRIVLEFERMPSGVLLQWRWLAVSSAIARRHSLNSAGRVVLQLNREMAMAQLLPSASQADGQTGIGQLWLLPADAHPEAEAALRVQRRRLRLQEGTEATLRGIEAAVVERARDQARLPIYIYIYVYQARPGTCT